MKVFLTGATGLLGPRLVHRLLERNDQPVVLTRNADKAKKQFPETVQVVQGDPTQSGDWMSTASECDAVVNLAGENLFNKRWSDKFKKVLRDSRVLSTQNVVQALARKPRRESGEPKVLVNASGIAYYGYTEDEELTEESPAGKGFLPELCVEWEDKAKEAESHGIRASWVRIGVVLAKEGGALQKLLLPFKMCVGGPVGSGKQWMSWIHHYDLIGMFLLALDRSEAKGAVNGTAPTPARNKEFSKTLGSVLGRPAILPTPGFALRLGLGEVAEVVTKGQKVLPKKAQELGYEFKHPELRGAMEEVLQKK